MQVGDWKGRELDIPQWALDVLGPGEFLERSYRRAADEPLIDFLVAYFPTQRTGATIHSPQNCLPGSGWTPVDFIRIQLRGRGSSDPITINRYVIAKGLDRMLVLYWYQAHGRVVASEYWAKFYLVADSVRMSRSDGGLVRIITPVVRNERPESAQTRAVRFAQTILPYLDSYIPH